MGVASFDHVALPTSNTVRCIEFYRRLGFEIVGEHEWHTGRPKVFSIVFGNNKINVHPETMVALRGRPEYLRGPAAEPGCGDVCFVWEGGVESLLTSLRDTDVAVIEGPVSRLGGRSAGRDHGVSVYVRDPDENLLEFISYDHADFDKYAV